MNTLTRRTFLKSSALATPPPPFRPLLGRSGAIGDIRVAVVGLNGRGRSHLRSLPASSVRVVALCDIDTDVLARARKSFASRAPR